MVSKCFLGCTNVRYGARIVAILDFWIGVILMIKFLSLLNPFYNRGHCLHSYCAEDSTLQDLIVFTYLFLIFVFLYINYYLKDSTYDRKVHKIYQWLAINTILFSFHLLAVTYITVKKNRFEMFYYSAPICLVHVFQIYVVKIYYDDQLNHLTQTGLIFSNNNAASVVIQRAPSGTVNMAANSPMSSDPIHQVQAVRPTVGQQHLLNVHPPTIYPQLQQQSTAPAQHRLQNNNWPQEYYNPPAYSPSCDSPPTENNSSAGNIIV